MFDSNKSKEEGVSVWGHVLDGMATGGGVGALFGGVGAIPGALLGGGLGLANGLADWYQEDKAIDNFVSSRHDDKTVDAVEREIEKFALDPKFAGMSDEEAVRKGSTPLVYQQRYNQEQTQGSSWFDDLF